ncbi:ATP-binding protein [Natrinema salaciae]|uniref:Histidine kinase-, DNA gyrase B-, and HSP90-like ATPase n=1 Tax=Natrinema salaciae TaxID=1186196 RepID=A0A1H9CLM0_9EURY|nr:ATP-binding protein [Natrinema salaciae]SEQ02059.1 Histidine kinase-, DNA gyrase B-, and HSP90-like ATPase [Natrinema salaciae]
MRKNPKVNEVNEFLEIASDFEDPLEVIRESLSNAYDANASNVEIEIRSREMGSDIIIDDDGDGMNQRDLESFFDLGNSRKTDSIGYKGHGTKIFYKSDRIVVNTASDEANLRAEMDKPWEKLNQRELPQYEVTETPVRKGNTGTRIRIRNFRSGQGFDPESLTYNKIEHYLKWKTIAGSTAYLFDDEDREMDITVKLGDEIDDSRPKLETTTRFKFPEEQLEPDRSSEFPAERMCKHYKPTEIEVEYEGGTTTLQIVGMVGGKAARNELPTYGKHSAQFGVWLAKDHIKVERLNEAISHDNEFLHFFFVVNCQYIELSANRESIRNKSSPVYQRLTEEAEYYLSKVAQDPWFKEYLETRRDAEIKRRARNRRSSLKDRRERIESGQALEPTNRTEVLLTLERANSKSDASTITVEDFDPNADVHAIVRQGGKLRNAAVHHSLTDHFEDDLTFEEVDLIICWEYGDPTTLREYERTGYLGGEVEFQLENDGLVYEDDGQSFIEILCLNQESDKVTQQAVISD